MDREGERDKESARDTDRESKDRERERASEGERPIVLVPLNAPDISIQVGSHPTVCSPTGDTGTPAQAYAARVFVCVRACVRVCVTV